MRILMLVTLTSLMSLFANQAMAAKTVVEMWLRTPGTNGTSDTKSRVISFDMTGLTLKELETYDIQYEKKVKVRGMDLRDMLTLFSPIPETVDIINLYTKSGMILPVSIGRLRQNVEVFVATTIFENNKWSNNFPESIRIEPESSKVMPVVFSGAKIVVGSDWRATENGFTPWRYMDTLTGIEFVESAAYADHFSHQDRKKQALSGQVAFLGRCQFCHGIQGIGATRGPDFSTLLKTERKDLAKYIFEKVQQAETKNPSLHFMPAQKDFTMSLAKDLVKWVKNSEKGKMGVYKASYKP
jgi:hypothetical protein